MVACVNVGEDREPQWQVLVIIAKVGHCELGNIPPGRLSLELVASIEHPDILDFIFIILINVALVLNRPLDLKIRVVGAAAEELLTAQVGRYLEPKHIVGLLNNITTDLDVSS